MEEERRGVNIDPQFVMTVKGNTFVRYVGLLDAATQAGLKEVSVKLLQFPAAENGYLAIAEATIVFEDGRLFTEVGDASPASTSAQMVVHSCRLAATRAKGRAFRDGLNVAAVMVEELGPDADPEPGRRSNGHAAPAAPTAPAPQFCAVEGCGVEVPATVAKAALARFGQVMCLPHGRELVKPTG